MLFEEPKKRIALPKPGPKAPLIAGAAVLAVALVAGAALLTANAADKSGEPQEGVEYAYMVRCDACGGLFADEGALADHYQSNPDHPSSGYTTGVPVPLEKAE